MQIQVLGAGLDVGRSCLLLSVADRTILLDCGAHHGFADKHRFPDFSLLPPDTIPKLDAVLITHFHFDHAAGLPFLMGNLKCPAPVYMTEPTRELARLMLNDVCTISASRNQFCPYSQQHISACLDRAHILPLDTPRTIGPNSDITITAYCAGHVVGAVMFHITIAGRSVLYSGDYSLKSDGHLLPARVPFRLRPHLFISETTYCSTVRAFARARQEDELMLAVLNTVRKNGKILIPISAFGRIESILSIFATHPERDVLRHVPMYIVEGLASRAIDLYDKFAAWTADSRKRCAPCQLASPRRKRSRFDDACNHSLMGKLRSFSSKSNWDLIHAPGPIILFATPGNMSTGLSLQIFHQWAPSPNNLVVIPGYSFAHTVAAKLLAGETSDASIRCRLVNMSLNCHVDGRGIIRMCRHVEAQSVMLIHGNKQNIVKFRNELQNSLCVPCFAPKNGDTVVIPEIVGNTKKATVSSTSATALSEEWQAIITAFDTVVAEHSPRSQQKFEIHGAHVGG